MKGRNFARKRALILKSGRGERFARKALAHLARETGAEPVYSGRKLLGHRLPDGFTICELRRYRDKQAAFDELRGIWRFAHLHENRLPDKAFPCPRCLGWHLAT